MNISLMLKGAAMGIAEAIPGVSGGTLAFITGIYEELIETIKSITPANLKLIFTDREAFWQAINGKFLLWLLMGMGGGLLLGVFVISHLMEHHQSLLWATFFGLVLGSAVFLAKDIRWDWKNVLGAFIGAVMAFWITTLAPTSGIDHPLYIIMAGSLAISALMLPGISGSFILLLLGLYGTIINGLKALIAEQDLSQLYTIILFAIGAFLGLFSFARILSFLFKKYKMTTMATMIGVLIGSLNKLWPWKKITSVYDKTKETISTYDNVQLPDTDNFKTLSEANMLPNQYALYEDPRVTLVVVCFVLGLVLVLLISKMETKIPHKES